MATYDELREKGYVQYIVLLRTHTYESSSIPALVFYYLVETDLTPTQIADSFKEAIKEFAKSDEYLADRKLGEIFSEFFKMHWHEATEFDVFENMRWATNPHWSLPITKIITLSGMEDYVEETPKEWLFQNRNKDNSVSSEIFNSIDIQNPRF